MPTGGLSYLAYTVFRMSFEGRIRGKVLLIVLLVCATLGAQAKSLASEQETHHGSDHCCRLCHMGPVPILPSAAQAVVTPVFSAVWVVPAGARGEAREVLLASAPSRGPPA
jgi:hypothetical protein